VLEKGARRIGIGLRRADLAHELEAALPRDVQLVTASALFDLVSAAFIDRLVRALAARGAALFAALTYDGEQRWAPPSDTDAAVCAAFNAHQRSDKGFGPAAGPEAGRLLGDALARAGYEVREGESAWELSAQDAALIGELVAGVAAAAAQTRLVAAERIERWRVLDRTAAWVGHSDLLAMLPHT